MKNKSFRIPPIGLRIIKSAIAVALCYVVQVVRGKNGIVFYSQLSALWCMQAYISTTRKNAFQRIIGTGVGAFFGLAVLLVAIFVRTHFLQDDFLTYVFNALLISVTLIPVLWTTVILKKKQASYFSCVVFLSIVVIHLSDQNPYLFTLNRFLDTMIGIVIGVGVNLFRVPHKKNLETLFVSGLDDTLLSKDYHINDYCKVELNRMIDEGLHFTLSTMRPPASILEPMSDIKLKLPVIAMDGAVLYDTSQKKYLKKISMTLEEKTMVMDVFEKYGIHNFANIVIDDTLLIYYQEFQNEIQKRLVEELRRSPYRNYIKRPVPDEEVIYFMLIYPDEKIEEIHHILQEHGITEKLKVLKYKSNDYSGYSYIKIYNKAATRQNMISHLQEILGVKKIVTFGTIPGRYDYVVEAGNTNQVVHRIKKLFEK